MLKVLQYDSARPRLQALQLNENPRSILGKSGGKKRKKKNKKTKKRTKRRKKEQKEEKLKKKRKNDMFLCKKAHKIAHSFLILTWVLKWVV